MIAIPILCASAGIFFMIKMGMVYYNHNQLQLGIARQMAFNDAFRRSH